MKNILQEFTNGITNKKKIFSIIGISFCVGFILSTFIWGGKILKERGRVSSDFTGGQEYSEVQGTSEGIRSLQRRNEELAETNERLTEVVSGAAVLLGEIQRGFDSLSGSFESYSRGAAEDLREMYKIREAVYNLERNYYRLRDIVGWDDSLCNDTGELGLDISGESDIVME